MIDGTGNNSRKHQRKITIGKEPRSLGNSWQNDDVTEELQVHEDANGRTLTFFLPEFSHQTKLTTRSPIKETEGEKKSYDRSHVSQNSRRRPYIIGSCGSLEHPPLFISTNPYFTPGSTFSQNTSRLGQGPIDQEMAYRFESENDAAVTVVRSEDGLVLSTRQIRCMCLCFGLIVTSLVAGIVTAINQSAKEHIPLPRYPQNSTISLHWSDNKTTESPRSASFQIIDNVDDPARLPSAPGVAIQNELGTTSNDPSTSPTTVGIL